MADIDRIISGAGGNTRADFSGIAEIPKAFWEARDQRAKNDLRDAFKGGVPTNPDGSIDYGAMQRTLYQKGAIDQGNQFVGIASRNAEMDALRGVDAPQTAQPTVGPSTSRNSVMADPTKRADAGGGQSQPQQAPPQGGQPQQQQPPTVMTVLAAQGIPNSELGAASESIARQIGVDVTQPIDLQDPRVRNVLAPAIAQLKRNRVGQVVQEGQPQAPPPQAAPPTMAQPVQVAAQNDPILRRLTLLAASPDKQISAAAKVRLEDYLKNRELTPDQKNAAASGKSLEDYQSAGDERTTQRDILTKSLIPKIEKSQENASAARNDIDAIHRSREELDRGGTQIFSGPFAEKRLALAKIADVLGVPNADRIEKTEAFSAAIGSRVAAMVKAFGSGTAISDGDRRFAAAMSGGNIELNEGSIRRILDIGERAGGLIIERHNKQVDKVVGANEALKSARDTYIVEPPGTYRKPERPAAAPRQQQSTIGSKADYDKLPKGATFTGPDGKQWRKP